MIRLFVYGTLKSGMRANYLLASGRYVGPARLADGYLLYDLGDHPALICKDQSKAVVNGELWEVPESAIPAMDQYEGVPDYFYPGTVVLADGLGTASSYMFAQAIPASAQAVEEWTPH